MDPRYRLVDGVPELADCRRLREVSGLTPVSQAQGAPAIANAWGGCHVVDDQTDGGWYFHITDIATDPDHQRRGLGAAVVERLLATIVVRPVRGSRPC